MTGSRNGENKVHPDVIRFGFHIPLQLSGRRTVFCLRERLRPTGRTIAANPAPGRLIMAPVHVRRAARLPDLVCRLQHASAQFVCIGNLQRSIGVTQQAVRRRRAEVVLNQQTIRPSCKVWLAEGCDGRGRLLTSTGTTTLLPRHASAPDNRAAPASLSLQHPGKSPNPPSLTARFSLRRQRFHP